MLDSDDERDSSRLACLAAALARLEERVARLEVAGAALAGQAAPGTDANSTEPEDAEPGAVGREVASVFASAAAASFCLLGALLLRAVAKQGWVPPAAGTAAGLAYAAVLVWLPYVARSRPLWAHHGPFLQICGVLIAPLIIVEMTRSSGALSVGAAALLAALIAVAGGLFAHRTGRRSLAVASFLAGAGGILSLGLTTDGAVARGAGLAVSAGVALIVAARTGWVGLRPAALLPAGLATGLAVVVTAHRPEVPPSTSAGLLAVLLSIWAAIAVNHLARARRLGAGEAGWLPAASFWIVPIAAWVDPVPVAIGAFAAGVLLSAAAAIWARERAHDHPRRPAAVGAALAGGAALVPALAVVDASGAGVGLVALMLAAVGSASASPALVLASDAFLLCAAAFAFLRVRIHDVTTASGASVGAALALALVILAHHRLLRSAANGGVPAAAASRPLALLAALVMAFSALRALLWLVVGARSFAVGQTVLLAAMSAGAALLGRRWQNRALHVYGAVAAAVLGVKVIAWDLTHLSGIGALTSIAMLGLSCLVFSLSLRRR